MKPGPALIANIILSELPLDSSPDELNNVIKKIIDEHPDWDVISNEKSFTWEPRVKKHLEKHLEQSNKQGKQPRFCFNSASEYKIQGACFIEPCDPPDIKEQKLRRLRWKDYYSYLRKVTPNIFETICARLLVLLGVKNPFLTPYHADQGIDFFGKMSIADLTGHGPIYPVFERELVFWLVGQAKHYPDSKISTPDIRALVGSTFLGRMRAFPKEDVLLDLRIKACDPLIMLFFTTGQISSEGWKLCRKSGIAAMDGEMIAAFLADKQVGVEGTGENQYFSPKAFSEWLYLR